MASNKTTAFTLDESRSSGGSSRFKTLRNVPKPWIVGVVLFYCASVITVGLLAGLLPRRTQHITVLATPEESSTTTPIMTRTTTSTATLTTTTHDPNQCIDDECNPRLSPNIIVDNYELKYFYNNTNQTTVQGYVKIEFRTKQLLNQIIYHAKRMISLDTPALYEDGLYRMITMKKYIPNDYVSLRLTTNSTFPPNRYELTQQFVVSLTDGSTGFYQNIFQDENQSMNKLLATKFEPTDARKAFPCFDEPHLKAQFKMTIHHPQQTIALANFPIVEETVENGLIRTDFAKTFRMSTYLAAWAILPETYGRKPDDELEPMITVWARKEPTDKNHTAFALDIASKSLSFFEEYFATAEAIPPKIDLLSIPDYPTGAMENWGLIGFREDRIIFDEKIGSINHKRQIAETISHEISHFWFGNYVTCKWWDDLWLNEAMASWLSYKPLTTNYTNLNMELYLLTEAIIPVMWDDAKPSSHPIVVKNVTTAAEITSLFDSITYDKGASVLRMLENIVGSDVFRDGLRAYLLINAFDVGDPTVLYNSFFTNTSGEEFMKSWLEELNYPLLNVNLKVENSETKLVFTQSRFIISHALNSTHLDNNYRWKISVKCVLGGDSSSGSDVTNIGGGTIEFILDKEQETQTLPGKSYSWIKCNRDFQGFYLTQYSFQSNNYQSFSNVLEAQPTFFSDEDKVNLMQDTFLLAYKGLIDYTEPLRIVRSLIKISMSQIVHWKTFQWHWDKLAELVDYLPDTLTQFQNFASQQILFGGLTLDNILSINSNDDDNTKLIKSLQFEFLCRMNHNDAINKASQLFKSIPVEYFNNSNVNLNIQADLLSTVYIYHLKNNDNEADWNMMYNYYKIAVSPQEQNRALIAISLTNNTNRLNQLLNEGLTDSTNTIKRQDYFEMMSHMSRHPTGRDVVWTFYQNNYQKLIDTFTLEHRQFGRSILSISRSFEKESYLQEMMDLFTKYPNAGAGASARKNAIDQVNMNIEWIKSREQNLRNALNTLVRQ